MIKNKKHLKIKKIDFHLNFNLKILVKIKYSMNGQLHFRNYYLPGQFENATNI
jgi:hypothetical protein